MAADFFDQAETRARRQGSAAYGVCARRNRPSRAGREGLVGSPPRAWGRSIRTAPIRMSKTAVHLMVELESVCKGGVLALASVEIEIAGVPITLQGLKLRRALDGRLTVELPMFEHPLGLRAPVIVLEDDLARGLAAEIAAAWEREGRQAPPWRVHPRAEGDCGA